MINEHDIRDHECRLYELHKGDKFKYDNKILTVDRVIGQSIWSCFADDKTVYFIGINTIVEKV